MATQGGAILCRASATGAIRASAAADGTVWSAGTAGIVAWYGEYVSEVHNEFAAGKSKTHLDKALCHCLCLRWH